VEGEKNDETTAVEGEKKDETTAVEPEKKDDTPSAEVKDKEAIDTVKSIIADKDKKEEDVVALPEFKYEHTYVSIE